MVGPCRFVQSTEKRMQRLKMFSQNSVVWFRIPYAHIILVSALECCCCWHVACDCDGARSAFAPSAGKAETAEGAAAGPLLEELCPAGMQLHGMGRCSPLLLAGHMRVCLSPKLRLPTAAMPAAPASRCPRLTRTCIAMTPRTRWEPRPALAPASRSMCMRPAGQAHAARSCREQRRHSMPASHPLQAHS